MSRSHRLCGSLVLAASLVAVPSASFAGVFVGVDLNVGIGVSVNFAPPPIPVYVQPPCVAVDTIWVPGYWAYGPYGYYWVPGTWVAAPQPGLLWTPGYWGYRDGVYAWHGGYWGRHIGFYGGVNYGFGYVGVGYLGGGWYGDHFRYNTAVTNVNKTTITNVYVNKTIVNNYFRSASSRVSYNGGPGGINRRPSAQELAYRSEQHVPATIVQRQHVETAAQNRNFLASINHGAPANAAVVSPLNLHHRPAGFTPLTSLDRRGAETGTTKDGWPRFNRPAQTTLTNAYHPANKTATATAADGKGATPIVHRSARLQITKSGQTYDAPAAYRAPSYHAASADHAPTSYHAASGYHAQTPYHAANTYHAPTSYHAASAYHAPTSYHVSNAYHAPTPHHVSNAYHAPTPHHAPSASHATAASHSAHSASGASNHPHDHHENEH